MTLIILTILCVCFFGYFLGEAIVAKKKKFPEVVVVLSSAMAIITWLLTCTSIVLTALEFCKN
nr:MAG TPA: hypothetical protein [Caudoviricetes sp.]